MASEVLASCSLCSPTSVTCSTGTAWSMSCSRNTRSTSPVEHSLSLLDPFMHARDYICIINEPTTAAIVYGLDKKYWGGYLNRLINHFVQEFKRKIKEGGPLHQLLQERSVAHPARRMASQ
ncbi:hypothetical protein M405DRAFT_886170 [Rhizopogon salebrosus TDB-379]|nr:hypothetical protein M405DRAFT_886170 [Rhizopogon salebrosus TDB-379]